MISRDESFEYIWKRIIEINNKYKPQWRKWDIRTFGIGLSKEVGEICDYISIIVGGGTKEKPKPVTKDFMFEVVDIIVYGVMFMNWFGIDYETFMMIFREKLNIVEQRLINKAKGEQT